MKLSQETKKLLVIMGFKNTEVLPTMTNLRKAFIRLAVEKHPDKGGSNEEFKELYRAYEKLGNLITTNTEKDEEESEEAEARK